MSNISSNERKYNEEKEQHHPQFIDKSKSESPNSSLGGSKPRVIEIPVQHFNQQTASHSPSSSSSSTFHTSGQSRNSPLNASSFDRNNHDEFGTTKNFGNFPSFNNSNLFDNYQSPFDLLNRRPLINRGEASNSNVPFSANFGGADADDFFTNSADRFFGRNSPLKDHLGAGQRRQASNSPARYAQTDSNLNAPSSSSGNTSNRQSPLNVNTDSPKRYTTQTTIQPNHSPNSKIGVEIPITHVASASPNKNEKSSYSDFQQPKTVPDTSKQHSTTPTRSGTNLSNEQGTTKMGNSSSSSTSTAGSAANSGKKGAAGGYENSDFASPISRPNQPPHQASQPKTDEEKCNEIEAELNGLEQEVANFAGTKTSDRSYLKLEELLTRCLLKLDAIERGEERINQTRRRLINFTHQLSDRLESRATENETKAGGRGGVDTSSNSSEGEQPASKRSKSPHNGQNNS